MLNVADQEINDLLPIIDISHDSFRQTVIAAGTPDIYQGHPTTALSADGSAVFCVWTINHGGACGPAARSDDGGRTWTRIDDIMPASYSATHRNCPTLQAIWSPDGAERRLCIFSSKNGQLGIVMSRDDGKSWYELPPADVSAGMPPTGLIQLKDGTTALFGQVRTDRTVKTDRAWDDQDIWMSVTKDGGFTWSPMRTIASVKERNLCEPCVLRSPDGAELCLIMRENRHVKNSMISFSTDEGQTWSTPVDTVWGLAGDRHEAVTLPDGRLFIAFRDRAPGASTYGQYVAWIGTYEDLRQGRPGQYRVHLLDHRSNDGWHRWDTGYSGVEILPGGDILCTTYTQHWDDNRKHSVVCTRIDPAVLK